MEASPARPVSVTIIAWVYIAVGVGGFAVHFHDLRRVDTLEVELTELLAALSGVFILRGQNWARWLALAWIAAHTIFSAFNSFPEFAVHAVFTGIIGWVLFRPAARYFWKLGR